MSHASLLAGFLDVLPAACDVLRDYQRRQLAQCAATLRAGVRRLLVQLPTGGGKTHEIAGIVLAATSAGLRVLILATRTRLVRQLHQRLEAFGVAHGVIAAEMRGMLDRFQITQIASADTLYRRSLADERMPLPGADVVIFDEAHLAAGKSRMAILDRYPEAVHIGFTATPARRSGRALSEAFDRLILGPSIAELIGAGMLVRPRIFNTPLVSAPELKAVKLGNDGDYAARPLGELLSRPKLVGDVVSNWLRIAAGRRTLVFAVDKAHGAQLTEEFGRAGVAAALLTDQDDERYREEVTARLEAGALSVVVNCFLMAYGVDLPAVDCIVLARPTRSLAMYLQMVGRGLRPAPEKDHCVLIDHGRVVETLGLPTAAFDWSLDGKRNVNREAADAQRRKPFIERPRTCPECQHIWLVSELGNACQSCGWAPTPKARAVAVEEADLREIAEEAAAVSPHSPEVARFYTQALAWYSTRWPDRWRDREKNGRWWAWVKTREHFEIAESVRMPGSFWDASPREARIEVAGWLKSRHIRDMKSHRWAA